MRQPERNIANELRHFEPEVDSAHMDQNWEKIRYFLPQEEKKRRFFFLFFKGTGLRLSIVLGFLTLAVLSFFYLRPTEVEQQVQSQFKGITHHRTLLQESNREQSGSGLSTQFKARRNLEKVKGKFQATLSGKPMERSPERHAPVLSSDNNEKAAEEERAVVAVKRRTKQSNGVEPVLRDSETLPESETFPETFLQLPVISIKALPFGRAEDSLCVLPFSVNETGFKSGIRNKMGVELLGGWSRSNTLWHPENTANEQEQKKSGFFGSAALVYSLKNKWHLNLGYTYIQDKTDFAYETNGTKVVATETTVIAVTSFVPDTLYKYFRVSSNTRVTSARSSFVSIGAGYVLLQQRKFALEILLQMSLRSTVYNVHTQGQIGTDTLLYVRTQGKPALGGQTETENGDQLTRERLTSYGFTSGFNLVYAINPKTSLLLRPACFIPVFTNPLRAAQPDFGIDQRNWFIGVGIRRYLGR